MSARQLPMLGAVTEELNKVFRAEQERHLALVRAAQTIREFASPTRADVLKVLEAVESMAYSYAESGECAGDIESAFVRLRAQLDRRTPQTAEQARIEAQLAWTEAGNDQAD